MEAPPRLELGVKALQASALPLGYGAVSRESPETKRLNTEIFKRPWSGLRDSNSLPPPWQGGALPDELNPQI